MNAINMPALPEPTMTWTMRREKAGTAYYTADQILADRLAVAQAVREACAVVCEGVTIRQNDGYDGDYEVGVEVGGDMCAVAIRALKIEGETR